MATLHRLYDLSIAGRRAIVVLLHLALIALSNYFAFQLRFDGDVPLPQAPLFWQMLPWLVFTRAFIFIPFRMYEGLWRYTGLWDLRNIVTAVTTSTVVFYLLVHYVFGAVAYSRSIFIIDGIILIGLMGGIRLTRRIYRDVGRPEGDRRVLIYGAGDAGEMIVRDMRNDEHRKYEPIGFVDDNAGKKGERIHGVPVLGTRADLPRIIDRYKPDEIVIAVPKVGAETTRAILKALVPFKLRITTLPNLGEILDGTVTVSQIRTLSVEDLLARPAIGLDPSVVRHFIEGRRVMVTGAGGSIGSELCRQIARLGPATLLMFERHENSLFVIANDLARSSPQTKAVAIVGDVSDQARLDAVLEQHKPQVIFHAAAHKHVPLMEDNPCEAIKNNVMATRMLADAAERHRVDRFILISTDKAVNPSSVMGATKRVAEMLVQSRATSTATSFSTVRFGNVLASNGSVVPTFLEQIKMGGPVTVTHPEMRRFFMLIPEAVQLVLHTGAAGTKGETFVLEMGEQVKVLDMARNLIRLSGLVPDEDIEITFIGLRPGEKLFEELVGGDEEVQPSGIENIVKVRSRWTPPLNDLLRDVSQLERLALAGLDAAALVELKRVVSQSQAESTELRGQA